MTKIFTIAFLSITSVYAQNNTFLKGKITNQTHNKCFLYVFKADKPDGQMSQIFLDSSDVKKDGTFSMAINLKEATEVIFYDGNEQTTVLLNPNDDINLTLNTKLFDETIMYTGKGSEKNNVIKNITITEEIINNSAFAYNTDTDTSVVFSYMREAYGNFKSVLEDYRKEIPELNNYIDSKLKSADQTVNYIKDNFAFTKKIANLIGTDGINFEGVDLKGKKIKISAFKGKITVIDFWATWCGPCKAEMPSFKALEEKYGTDINFVSVGLFCENEKWVKMATDYGFKNNMFLGKEEEKQISNYDVKFIPRYIVLDKNQKVIDALAPRPSSGDLQKYFK